MSDFVVIVGGVKIKCLWFDETHVQSVYGSAPSVVFPVANITRPPMVKQHTTGGFTGQEEEVGVKLECSVCYNFYSDKGSEVPRSLLCGHTFCTSESQV